MTTLDEQTDYINPQSVSPFNTALKYGLIAGLVSIIFGLIFQLLGMVDYTGETKNYLPSIVDFAVMIIFLVLAVKKHRDDELGGYISFGRIMKLGVLMGVIIGVMSAIWTSVYFTIIDPNVMQETLNVMEEKFIDQGMSEDELEMAMKWTSWMIKPMGMAIIALIGTVFMQTIYSLVVGIIMKKDSPYSA